MNQSNAREVGLAAATAILAFAALSGTAYSQSRVNLLKNGDFERPLLNANPPPQFGPHAAVDLPYFAYPYRDAGGSAKVFFWRYRTTSGIISTAQGSNPFYGATSPTGFSGIQYAFIQDGGKISQTFQVTTSGTYEVRWVDAGRPACQSNACDGNERYRVSLGGTLLGAFATTSGQQFVGRKARLGLTAGTYTIFFTGVTFRGDHTAFIDKVTVRQVVH